MDTLDYTGPEINKGRKGILIGVGEPVRDLPHEFRGDLPYGANAVRSSSSNTPTTTTPTTHSTSPATAPSPTGH